MYGAKGFSEHNTFETNDFQNFFIDSETAVQKRKAI